MGDKNQQQPELQIKRIPFMERLKKDVTHFHEKTGMQYSTIGMKAIGNGRFWQRLQDGGDIGLSKADQIYFWMETQGFNFNS